MAHSRWRGSEFSKTYKREIWLVWTRYLKDGQVNLEAEWRRESIKGTGAAYMKARGGKGHGASKELKKCQCSGNTERAPIGTEVEDVNRC